MISLIKTGAYSDEEKELLIQLSEEGKPIKEIAEELNRSYTSINNARKNYWKSRNRKNRTIYTENEKELIEKYFSQGKSDGEIADKLGRSKRGIKNYRQQLRAVNLEHDWSDKEEEILLMYIVLDHLDRVVNYEELTDILKRTQSGIAGKINHLRKAGILPECLCRSGSEFSEEEIERIIQLRENGKSISEIAKELNRSNKAIYGKLFNLGFVEKNKMFWTKEEIKIMLEMIIYDHKNKVVNRKEISTLLNRSEQSVGDKIVELRKSGVLPKVNERERLYLPWSNKEEAKLIHLRKHGYTMDEISEIIIRPKSSVYKKIKKLRDVGILKRKKTPWTEEEIELIIKNAKYDSTLNITNYYELSALIPAHTQKAIRSKVTRLRSDGLIKQPIGIADNIRKNHDTFNRKRFSK